MRELISSPKSRLTMADNESFNLYSSGNEPFQCTKTQTVSRPTGNLTARLRPVNIDSQFVQMFTTTHLLDFIPLRAKEKQTSLS